MDADLDRLHDEICGALTSVRVGLSSVPPSVAAFVSESLSDGARDRQCDFERIVDLASDALESDGVGETSFEPVDVRIAVREACMRFAEEKHAPREATGLTSAAALSLRVARELAGDASRWDACTRASLATMLDDAANVPILLDAIGLALDWRAIAEQPDPAVLGAAIERGCCDFVGYRARRIEA